MLHAPKIQTVPLPLVTTPTATSPPSVEVDGVFPLNILEGHPTSQSTALHSIVLTTPVHVHTPVAHIGTVVHDGHVLGQRISALELTEFLQAFVWQPIDLPMNSSATTSERSNRLVELAPSRPFEKQDLHSLASHLRGGVVGYDLLLGNFEIWGFESLSVEGNSVIHLSGNPSGIPMSSYDH